MAHIEEHSFGHNDQDVNVFATNFCSQITKTFKEADVINNMILRMNDEYRTLTSIHEISYSRISYESFIGLLNICRQLTHSKLELCDSSTMSVTKDVPFDDFKRVENKTELTDWITTLRKYSREGKVVSAEPGG